MNPELQADPDGPSARRRPSDWRVSLVLAAFLAIAGFFLLTEHRAHLFGFLPYLLLLACPLLHVFMHGGHKSHRHTDAASPSGGRAEADHRHSLGPGEPER